MVESPSSAGLARHEIKDCVCARRCGAPAFSNYAAWEIRSWGQMTIHSPPSDKAQLVQAGDHRQLKRRKNTDCASSGL